MTPPAGPPAGPPRLGFSAVVGHDDLKLALLLAAVDPAIGGVLLRGDKGSGKTTLARALAGLLPGDAPFVDLPLGATEDRVLGSIDIGAALSEGAERVRRGLLADADGGVLYVDEVNLLADHLVDALLDVAASGEHRLERDGVSVVQPARFVLVGTMNPEEGELRPQLLDRFGLCVMVVAPSDPEVRAEIVRRRLATDRGDGAGNGDGAGAAGPHAAADARLRARLAGARPAAVGDDVIAFATRLALAVGAEGVRADIVLCRAAAALAGWDGRAAATPADVERIAPLALAHRRRRSPFDPPTLDPAELDEALGEARRPPPAARRQAETPPSSETPDGTRPDEPSLPDGRPPADARDPADESGHRPDGGAGGPGDARDPAHGSSDGGPGEPRSAEMGAERRAPRLPVPAPGVARPAAAGRRAPAPATRGREVRDVPAVPGEPRPLAVAASVRAVARRRATEPGAAPRAGDLRASVRQDRAGATVIIVLDTSGSMGARERVRAATGAVLGLLTDAYQRRDRVAVVTFDGSGARVVLNPTSSVEVARSRLAGLSTGGTTPLAAGLGAGLEVATREAGPGGTGRGAVLVVVTDGRATGGEGALADAMAAAGRVRAARIPALVLDAETGGPRLGLAGRLAEAMGAACRPLTDLTAGALRDVTSSPGT